MSKRVTIMLENTLESKVRGIQAKRIKDTNSSFSFSACINELVKKGLNV